MWLIHVHVPVLLHFFILSNISFSLFIFLSIFILSILSILLHICFILFFYSLYLCRMHIYFCEIDITLMQIYYTLVIDLIIKIKIFDTMCVYVNVTIVCCVYLLHNTEYIFCAYSESTTLRFQINTKPQPTHLVHFA